MSLYVIIGSSMAAVRRRKSPKTDAVEHAAKALDKTAELEVKYINSFKGRGVFAKAHFHKGDFVVEYRGELINSEESQRRRRTYHVKCTVFMFDFHWQERTWCIDAAREDGSLGRLVNDDNNHPNCKMKKVISEGKPHLCLFALRDINVGEEITYDYGGTDWPWRKKVGGPLTVTGSSDADISSTKDQDPDRSSCSQKQVGGPSTVTRSKISRTKDQDPDRSSCSQKQVGGPSTVTRSKISRTKDQDPDRSSCSQKQVGGPSTVTRSKISRTKDQDPDRSSCSQKQVGGPSTVTRSKISRTKDQDPDRSSCSQKQVGGPSTVTESSDADISSTKDQDPDRSSCSQKQVGGPSTVTRSKISRTKDQDPDRSSCSQKQVGGPSTVTRSKISRTKDQDPVRSSCSQKQGSDELGLHLPKKNVGMNQSVVNYMDSDESQCSSTCPANFDKTSETELSLSEQDQECVPLLRRTKSIQVNNQIHSDSDELVDPSSADSGEEYIPKTSEDYSDGTDTSEVLEPVDQRESMLRSLNCVSLAELNNGSSMNVVDRGRSPSRKGSKSGMAHKRPYLSSVPCPKTQTTSGQSPEQSGRGDTGTPLENSTLDLEKNLLDSNSHPLDSVAGGSLSIPAVSKKENGSRIYNKKQYCLYCKLGVVKMARHLERAHQNKPEVAQAVSFPKGSKERRMHLEHLRNRGNFAHNIDVLNSGVGNLVPRKQPKQDCQAKNFLHCIYCHGFFTKKVLWRHMTICKFKPGVSQKPGKTRVQALCAFAAPPPPGVKVEFWKLLSNMIQDEVYSAVKSDVCIMEFGEHLYNRLGHDVGKHEYILQKLRELGRLLVCSRKTTPLKTIQDHVRPVNFMHVVEAVKRVAGYDSETNAYKRPSLALKIGHSLTKISMLVESRANVQTDYSAAKDARTFRRVYETRWNELISAASLRTLQESKWNAPLLLPFTKDVQTLHSYLDMQQRHSYSKLSTETSPPGMDTAGKGYFDRSHLVQPTASRRGVKNAPLCIFVSKSNRP
ncbi:uncharacterized protein LOC127367551 isoform X9 [Dicentrarchus labrax]|uniref:uncharacterized protein LOC127367551 isoform X5 n=1 Tax=Dicentrarchus labrax TaxID=13489 RepID=UPI0021F543D6|nr:uncharacterized protein LOC127367551 isoform X5 [Dicentrarchus labrax]XP_051263439.1 uncharacterized protein LOC127367551 isoform X6 [Dicentrarchus labrax]XP_051263440.1 uncharacterized protein LOC127367551 isoform X7 [Dicentrarchus labrax]XP_051263441.1 uncharacterized protein LOC127367551 isoform X8 [Dicentrarchus labrax]XP_051263442.1 uncharacterized protein LOC127367551 isoform X9 [Dicentrarchus labrax]